MKNENFEDSEPQNGVDFQAGRDIEIAIGRDFVAGNVNYLTQIAEQTIVQGLVVGDIEMLPPEEGHPPYQGLIAFEEKDTEWFFGRDYLINDIVKRLYDSNFLAVVGASGSGKSSVIKAGVVAALKGNRPLLDGLTPPNGKWQSFIITPTIRPLDKLAFTLFPNNYGKQVEFNDQLAENEQSLLVELEKIIKHDESQKYLIVVDQFEELFTQCKVESHRTMFINNLMRASLHPNIKVIITLRADFYMPCLAYKKLKPLLENQQIIIEPMSRAELTEAILAPAAKGDWKFQAGLEKEMLDDVGLEPGALPLLSHALLETWYRRHGRILTLSGYGESGGVSGAIAKTAENTYQSLSPQQQEAARFIFLSLTELGQETQDTRRAVTINELVSRFGQRDTLRNVLDLLAAQNVRLIIPTQAKGNQEETVEVAHEAIIRKWPRLREWLDDSRESLYIQRQVADAAIDWENHSRDISLLYRGIRLAQAQERVTSPEIQLNDLEREFLSASQAAIDQAEQAEKARAEAEKAQAKELSRIQQQGIRRLRTGLIIVVIISIIAIGAAFRAYSNGLAAEANAEEAIMARSTAEANDALAQQNEAEAIAARSTAEASAEAESNARQTAEEALQTNIYRLLASNAEDFVEDRLNIAILSGLEGLYVLDNGGFDTINNASEANVVKGNLAQAVFYSPHLSTLHHHNQISFIQTVSTNYQGNLSVSGDATGTIAIWDNIEKQPVKIYQQAYPFEVDLVEFNPNPNNHDQFASVGCINKANNRCLNWEAYVWDVDENTQRILPSDHLINPVTALALSSDGRWLAVGDDEGIISMWDMNNDYQVYIMEGHDAVINDLTFNFESSMMASASKDTTIILWDSNNTPQKSTLLAEPIINTENEILSVAFNTSGRWLAFGGRDLISNDDIAVQELFPLNDTEPLVFTIDKPNIGSVHTIEFTEENKLVTGSISGRNIRLYQYELDVETEQWIQLPDEVSLMEGHSSQVVDINLSQDGSILTSGSTDKAVGVWNVALEDKITPSYPLQFENEVRSIAISPDGSTFAAGDSTGDVYIGQLSNNDARTLLTSHSDGVNDVIFDKSGELVFSASEDHTIKVKGVNTDSTIDLTLQGHTEGVNSIALDASGQILASGSDDNTVIIWDLSKQDEWEPTSVITSSYIITDHTSNAYSVTFYEQGDQLFLVTGSGDETVKIWSIDTSNDFSITLQQNLPQAELVRSVSVNPQSSLLAVGTQNGTILLWDLLTFTPVGNTMTEHDCCALYDVNFDKTGQLLLSTGTDDDVAIWDVGTQRILLLLTDHTGDVRRASFIPPSQNSADVWFSLASASDDGTVRLWEFDMERILKRACDIANRPFTEEEWRLYVDATEPYRETCVIPWLQSLPFANADEVSQITIPSNKEIFVLIPFEDSFTDNKNDWPEESSDGESITQTWRIADGHYLLEATSSNNVGTLRNIPDVVAEDFYLEFDFEIISSTVDLQSGETPQVMISLRRQDNANHYNLYLSNSTITMGRRVDSDWEWLTPDRTDEPITVEMGSQHTIGLLVKETDFFVFFDGKQIANFEDSSLTERGIIALGAVMARSERASLTIQFDNVKVEEPSDPSSYTDS
ncbi:MAG: hypothetical protein KDE51_05185 [Anaerolineales bacterium]|nr:hypothetical protein [Anaerolineales bacterium]